MRPIRAFLVGIMSAAAVLPGFAPAIASTSGGVSHSYDVSISGIRIGDATLSLHQTGDAYDLSVTGGFRFLFWTGGADARSYGNAGADGLTPLGYRSRFESPTRVFTTEIDFAPSGPVRSSWATEPPLDPDEFDERVPITDADLIGARDPLASFVIPAASGAEACARSLKVFSGVVRFDVSLTAGAAGPDGVVPCEADYQPVSGHRTESTEVDRLRDRGLVMSLFEIETGLWAPASLGFQTRFGTLRLDRRAP